MRRDLHYTAKTQEDRERMEANDATQGQASDGTGADKMSSRVSKINNQNTRLEKQSTTDDNHLRGLLVVF